MQNINNFVRICIFCIIIVPLQRICISMVEESMYIPEFEQYIRATEPDVRERADIWRTAIGLQQVDRLTVSDFLKKTAERNIIGEISIDQAGDIVRTYYQSKENRLPDEDDKEEADKVATNIARILGQESFTYSIAGLAAVHKQIFADVFKHAGQFRQYDITKKEWVLNGETVLYTHYDNIRMTLEYDLEQERQFDYGSLSITDAIEHIAKFVSGLWQIHPFAEGNTRTTAIFTIKYLRSMGFSQINNELFEKHSWYFRNALVRANYRNLEKNINPDCAFLVLFLRNLLLGEQNELHNRTLHVDWNKITQQSKSQSAVQSVIQSAKTLPSKCNFCTLNELAVLHIIQKQPNVTQKEIARLVNKSERTIKTLTVRLTELGIIERRDGKRDGYWEIIYDKEP